MHAVITAAGYGTRLLPATKEIPKEMLPLPFMGSFKPIIQIVFEQLFEKNIRDFVIVVGRGKRVIEDHFTPDYEFTKYLDSTGKSQQSEELKRFYSIIEKSNITWVNQLSKKGFGDAVMRAEPFVGEDFLVIGADHIPKHLPDMPISSILVTRVNDPINYGVVKLDGENNIIDIWEKPSNPESDIIAMPYYRFDRRIFDELHSLKPDNKGELQLTEGIRMMLKNKVKIKGIFVEEAYDLGTVEKYINSYLNLTKS